MRIRNYEIRWWGCYGFGFSFYRLRGKLWGPYVWTLNIGPVEIRRRIEV